MTDNHQQPLIPGVAKLWRMGYVTWGWSSHGNSKRKQPLTAKRTERIRSKFWAQELRFDPVKRKQDDH